MERFKARGSGFSWDGAVNSVTGKRKVRNRRRLFVSKFIQAEVLIEGDVID